MKKILGLSLILVCFYSETIYAGGKVKLAKEVAKQAGVILTPKGRVSMKNLTLEQKQFIKNLPKTGGTYSFGVKDTNIPYVGQANSFSRRIKEHIGTGKLELDKIKSFTIKTKDRLPNSPVYNQDKRNMHEAVAINLNKIKSVITKQKLPNIQIPKIGK